MTATHTPDPHAAYRSAILACPWISNSIANVVRAPNRAYLIHAVAADLILIGLSGELPDDAENDHPLLCAQEVFRALQEAACDALEGDPVDDNPLYSPAPLGDAYWERDFRQNLACWDEAPEGLRAVTATAPWWFRGHESDHTVDDAPDAGRVMRTLANDPNTDYQSADEAHAEFHHRLDLVGLGVALGDPSCSNRVRLALAERVAKEARKYADPE